MFVRNRHMTAFSFATIRAEQIKDVLLVNENAMPPVNY